MKAEQKHVSHLVMSSFILGMVVFYLAPNFVERVSRLPAGQRLFSYYGALLTVTLVYIPFMAARIWKLWGLVEKSLGGEPSAASEKNQSIQS